MKYSKIITQGDGNVTVQDVSDSVIHINSPTDDEIIQFVRELQEWHQSNVKNILNLLVLTTTKDRIEAFADSTQKPYLPIASYNEKLTDWKPFAEEGTIFDIIQEFKQETGFKVETYFIDDFALTPALIADLKDDISPQTVLLVDCLSLHFSKNKAFAQIFDKNDIGGCLIPVCAKHGEELKDTMKALSEAVFSHLHLCFWQRFKREYMHIELEIPCKKRLYRRLTNIAVKCLEVQRTNLNWSPQLQKLKNDDSLKGLNSSF